MGLRQWLTVAVLLAAPAAADAHSVVTYHNSNQRHGSYIIHGLTIAAAATMHLDTGFNATLQGNIYAQPLFWRPDGSTHGQVIVATESNFVYALNETTGAIEWQTQLGPSVPRANLPCGNIDPVGVTGTPVIDPIGGVLYLNALTQTDNGPRHMVHALSLADGSEKPGWPFDMEAGLTGMGLVYSSSYHGERSALLFFKNNLYVNYGGNGGDCGTYHGTVVQLTPDTPTIVGAWQTRGLKGGIWAQGGIAGDGVSLFITTGNTHGATDWSDGEAIIRLVSGLAHSNRPKDFFTPSNWADLDSSDKDLGGTEALPLDIPVAGQPKARRIIAFGKDGNAYLADRHLLGGIGGQLAIFPASTAAIRTAPAVYETDSTVMIAFTSGGNAQCPGKNITMLNVAAGSTEPVSFAWCAAMNGGGAPIVTTTDGTANAIVWVVGAEGDNLLHGFNALNGQTVFDGTGTTMTGLHHFETILATATRFYVAADNTVYAFAFVP